MGVWVSEYIAEHSEILKTILGIPQSNTGIHRISSVPNPGSDGRTTSFRAVFRFKCICGNYLCFSLRHIVTKIIWKPEAWKFSIKFSKICETCLLAFGQLGELWANLSQKTCISLSNYVSLYVKVTKLISKPEAWKKFSKNFETWLPALGLLSELWANPSKKHAFLVAQSVVKRNLFLSKYFVSRVVLVAARTVSAFGPHRPRPVRNNGLHSLG